MGAAAVIGWSAPQASKGPSTAKKGAAAAPPSGSSSARKGAAAKAAGTNRRMVGRRPARRRGSDHYMFIGQQRPAPERILEIEQALSAQGFLAAPPDTVWDDATTDAMRRFQQSQNLTVDGKLTSLSLLALGLGPRRNAATAAAAAAATTTLPAETLPAVATPPPPPPPPPPDR